MLLLGALAAALAWAPSSHASADLGTLELHTGALRLGQAGDMVWRPVVRGAFAFEVVGPLHVGGYVQLTGYELPLRSAQPGGGLYASVRPQLPMTRLRPSVDASLGRLRLPVGNMDAQPSVAPAQTFVVGVAGAVGVAVAPAVTLEARVEYAHYFGVDASVPLDRDSLGLLVGMTIRVP